MWINLLLVLLLLLFIVIYRIRGWGGNGSLDLLEMSFDSQQAMVHGKPMPASDLRVVHRWRPSCMTSRWGDVLMIDVNWLCRSSEGLFVLGIAQGGGDGTTPSLYPHKLFPPDIRWVWRSLSEDRVRQMLTPTPRIYRKVFGVPVPRR